MPPLPCCWSSRVRRSWPGPCPPPSCSPASACPPHAASWSRSARARWGSACWPCWSAVRSPRSRSGSSTWRSPPSCYGPCGWVPRRVGASVGSTHRRRRCTWWATSGFAVASFAAAAGHTPLEAMDAQPAAGLLFVLAVGVVAGLSLVAFTALPEALGPAVPARRHNPSVSTTQGAPVEPSGGGTSEPHRRPHCVASRVPVEDGDGGDGDGGGARRVRHATRLGPRT